jgi:aquaporin Z
MSLVKRCLAEFIGTCWLVFGGCGSAVLAAAFTADAAKLAEDTRFPLGIGLVGVSLAFGLTVMTMAYAIGHISGCHLNPAVSIGLWAAKRFPGSELFVYIGSQVFGAILGAGIIYLIATGKSGFELTGSNPLATNGFGVDHSPSGYSWFACFIAELFLSFMFLVIILGSTDHRAPQGFAPIAIGLGLTLIHLISIPVTNTSVNPARSLGPAVFVGGWAIQQLWLFWIAPILGGFLAGIFYSQVLEAPTPSERKLSEVQS